MCVDIVITDDLKVEDGEQFRVFLISRTSFGVDAWFNPRRTTVVIVDDDAPSKCMIILHISKHHQGMYHCISQSTHVV